MRTAQADHRIGDDRVHQVDREGDEGKDSADHCVRRVDLSENDVEGGGGRNQHRVDDEEDDDCDLESTLGRNRFEQKGSLTWWVSQDYQKHKVYQIEQPGNDQKAASRFVQALPRLG